MRARRVGVWTLLVLGSVTHPGFAAPPQGPAAPAPIPIAAPAPAAVGRRTVALVAAGVAVVGAGLATTFGLLALQARSEYQSAPTYANTDAGNDDAAYADGALALAVAAGVTSLILALTSASAPDPGAGVQAPRVLPSPVLARNGGGVGALLLF